LLWWWIVASVEVDRTVNHIYPYERGWSVRFQATPLAISVFSFSDHGSFYFTLWTNNRQIKTTNSRTKHIKSQGNSFIRFHSKISDISFRSVVTIVLINDNFFLVSNFNSHEKHSIGSEYVTAHSMQMTISICGLSTIRLVRAKHNETLVPTGHSTFLNSIKSQLNFVNPLLCSGGGGGGGGGLVSNDWSIKAEDFTLSYPDVWTGVPESQ
jgi:hypothetical protein